MERFIKPKIDKYISLYSKYAKAEDLTYKSEGFVSSVEVTNGGFYYDDGILDYLDSSGNPLTEYPPTITFSSPQNGSDTATGTPILEEGALVGINITNNGSGYTSAPTITITAPTYDDTLGNLYSGEIIYAVYPSDSNGNFLIDGTGIGYDINDPPTVTIAAPSSGVTATAVVSEIYNGKITRFDVTNAGSGYDINNPPTVTISGGGGTGAFGTALFRKGAGATATATLTFEPDVIKKYSWDLETPIEVNENALISVVDRQFQNIPSGDVNKPIMIRMFEIGTKSIVNCKNTSSNQFDTFYQGRIIDMGLPQRSVNNDLKLEINQQMIDRITLSVNHGLTSNAGCKYDTDFVIILKVEEKEPSVIEYGNLNNLNINQV